MTPEIAILAQTGLRASGFDPGPIDGIWGPKSESAFRQWLASREQPEAPGVVPAWLVIARKEIGQGEIPGTRHNPRIVEYHQTTKLAATTDEVPWCSSFACWCIEQAGLPSPKSAWARDWLLYGIPMSKPILGAIGVFRRGQNFGHVGFIERWDDSRIWLTGGNQSNRVSIAPYQRNTLLGIRWPT